MSENHVFRGGGRTHLTSGIAWWGDPGTQAPLLLAWCILLFSSTTAQDHARHGNCSLPELAPAYHHWPANWELGSNPLGRGSTQSSLLPMMCSCPEAVGQKAGCFAPITFSWTWGCLWGWVVVPFGPGLDWELNLQQEYRKERFQHTSFLHGDWKLRVWPGHEEGKYYLELTSVPFQVRWEHYLLQGSGETRSGRAFENLLSCVQERRIKMNRWGRGLICWLGEGKGCPRRGTKSVACFT